ncbi:MAG: phytoene/squalene synthase family protein [Gammaproteobacteria bacterium]
MPPSPAISQADLAFQDASLQGVSRTFALTIPQLPEALQAVVGNAYLLCRIADTIEDDPGLSTAQKTRFSESLIETVAGRQSPETFANSLLPLLTGVTTPAEQELIRNTDRVVGITHRFSTAQREELERCVRIMSRGMAEFQRRTDPHGVPDLPAFERYCYYVAGVVGEMLTGLFCHYSEEIRRNRSALMELAVSFGAVLQMTNILKDVWEDRRRGACWLPRDIFHAEGFELRGLSESNHGAEFRQGMRKLIALAHGHLQNGLDYILLIPARESGIRRFCLWSLAMSALTLRKLNAHLDFTSGGQVKISRRAVRFATITTRLLAKRDRLLRHWFGLVTSPLPEALPLSRSALLRCREGA